MAKSRYGTRHQRIRAALLPLAYGKPCHFCGQLMQPGDDLHLDHAADGRGYRGFAHAACNVSDGARRGYREMLRRRGLGQGGVF